MTEHAVRIQSELKFQYASSLEK